jgi:hypothetical protein
MPSARVLLPRLEQTEQSARATVRANRPAVAVDRPDNAPQARLPA